MAPIQLEIESVKARMRSAWMAGDFGQIAVYSARCAEEFVDRLKIQPWMRVLDVACGTGNLAIPAARSGAQVSGVDIATNLLAQARQRAAAERLPATFDVGDAEQLPCPDAYFDVVMTMFGAMFAPRPELVAAELARVCRQGKTIAMANWTPEGFVGKMFALGSQHVPPAPGVPPPAQWGDEAKVLERMGPYVTRIQMVRRRVEFRYPFPPAEVVQLFRRFFGPIVVAFSQLDPAGQAAYEEDLKRLWTESNEAGEEGSTLVSAEYLEMIAVRR
jgi:SAM-dependent methyltransferase